MLPVATMLLAGVGLVAMHYGRRGLAAGVVLCFACAWAAAAVCARVVFPLSLAAIWLILLCIACAGVGMSALLICGQPKSTLAWIASAAFGLVVGFLVVRWQIPEPPSTIPWNPAIPSTINDDTRAANASNIRVSGHAYFQPIAADLLFSQGDIRLRCSLLLDFDRISLDHFWSLLARRRWTPDRQFLSQRLSDDESLVRYNDGSSVHIRYASVGGVLELTAYTPVRAETYSHLNSFCYLEISGHKSLAIKFSPCADAVIDVLPADYPFGRPARFAYLDANDRFRICEATSGEKGPFRELAAGKLSRGEPLAITFYDEGHAATSVTLDDWSAQASTAISPTAGWGVPVNAIEFHRFGDSPSADAGIWVTLAATSVGRGFETVGHRPGTYRNHITIRGPQSLPPAAD